MTPAEAKAELRKLLPPGTRVYTVLRHVSASGMSRSISLMINGRDGIQDLDWLVMQSGDWKIDRKNGGIKVGGCGMDMGFHLVYSLSRSLYPRGFNCPEYKRGELAEASDTRPYFENKPYRAIGERKAKGKRCGGNDHVNYRRGGSPVPYRHRDGGYALDHQWL